MSNSAMLALGEYVFFVPLSAYNELKHSTEYRWVSQDRYKKRPAKQFLGPGNETIDLTGVIFPEQAEHLNQVEAMRAEAAKGTPLPLADNYGDLHGEWVILSIEETRSHHMIEGTPLKIEYALHLEAYEA